MAAQQPIQIRSFRVCFSFERRIHKIDRWRIPLPFGVPLIGLGYAVAALVAITMLTRFPVIGTILMALPAPVRLLLLPVGVAYGLTRWEIDGRAAHTSLAALLRLRLGSKRVVAFRPAAPVGPMRFGSVTIASDDRGARMQPAVIEGPARVILRYPVQTRARRRTLSLSRTDGPAQWRGTQITLKPGQRAVVR